MSAEILERNFTGLIEICEKHGLSLFAEGFVFDDGVELVVDRHAEWVEVSRSDAHPAAVDDARFRVHHLALPFPDANAVREQSPIISTRDQRHPRMIVAA